MKVMFISRKPPRRISDSMEQPLGRLHYPFLSTSKENMPSFGKASVQGKVILWNNLQKGEVIL
jgi:hypothetical protein